MKQAIYSYLMKKGFKKETLDLLNRENLMKLATEYSFNSGVAL